MRFTADGLFLQEVLPWAICWPVSGNRRFMYFLKFYNFVLIAEAYEIHYVSWLELAEKVT